MFILLHYSIIMAFFYQTINIYLAFKWRLLKMCYVRVCIHTHKHNLTIYTSTNLKRGYNVW